MPATCTEDILRDNCVELDSIFIVGMLLRAYYITHFPLRGAMREFFGTSDLFLPYGHCECYKVFLFALVARKLRAMVQSLAGDFWTNVLHTNFTSPFS